MLTESLFRADSATAALMERSLPFSMHASRSAHSLASALACSLLPLNLPAMSFHWKERIQRKLILLHRIRSLTCCLSRRTLKISEGRSALACRHAS
ncbi:Uncharacterised protein [Mycobacteroides abscessus subsp. abscessus]|nr:Uncharacterised protein [Mycobacteroides abscessus subsp. abscessus]